jgi:hypothetical protein
VKALLENLPNVRHVTFKVEIKFYRDLLFLHEKYHMNIPLHLLETLDRLEKEEDLRPKVDLVIDHIPKKRVTLDRPYLKELYDLIPKEIKEPEIIKKVISMDDIVVLESDLDQYRPEFLVIYDQVLNEITKRKTDQKKQLNCIRLEILKEIEGIPRQDRLVYENGTYKHLFLDDKLAIGILDKISQILFENRTFHEVLTTIYPISTQDRIVQEVFAKFDWYLQWKREQDFLDKLQDQQSVGSTAIDIDFEKYNEYIRNQVERLSKSSIIDHNEEPEKIEWLNPVEKEDQVPFFNVPILDFYKKIKSL